MRIRSILAGALLALLAASATAAGVTVTVVNRSDYAIHHFFLSSAAESEWGPDQLGEQILEIGGRFALNGIPAGRYDVKLVDEDGDECVIEAVDITASGYWDITKQALLECEADGTTD